MKKLFLGMAAVVMLFTSCSGSDDGGSASINSHILIDGVAFTPDANSGPMLNVMTSFSAGINNGQANARVFGLNNQEAVVTIQETSSSLLYIRLRSQVSMAHMIFLPMHKRSTPV